MMKWLFGFLLLLSIILFALMQWGGALTGTGKNVPTLLALHPEKIKLQDISVVKQSSVSTMPSTQAASAVSTPISASMPIAASTAALAPVSVSAPVAISSLLPVPLPVKAAAPLAKAATKTCMEWGEFSGTDLARLEKDLAGLKLSEQLTKRTVEYELGYRVFIPYLPNQAAIRKKIEEIKAAGIDEYYVLKNNGKWNNSISLGMFKTEAAAQHYLATIQKKGIHTVKVTGVKRKLKFIVFMFKGIDAEDIERLNKLQKDFVNSELKKVACTN